jgi:vacuolar-type H+-ATPase subunit H
MDDRDLLQHLLEIESEASALVEDAQTEADRRIKEAEEQNRASYDERFRGLAEQLDREYVGELSQVRAEYRQTLDAYRAGLEAMPVTTAAFRTLASSLLFTGGR